ncbi:MAG: ParB/RepB/Spo0J family partition protein [Nitrospinaceae bacterium]|nr:MAG: ParB/RepB/Spo0J family partition protein [Nitrospinaceae bacterium]
MNRDALGKGINALIPNFEEGLEEKAAQGGVVELLVDEIQPNPLQPRKHFDDEKLDELVQSIRENGVLQPVIVQKKEKGYELVVGERRWRASQKANLKKIPVIVREVSETRSLEIALIENIQRQDLNPIEEAEAYARLGNDFGLTQEQLAKRLGKSRVAITNTLRLLNLSPAVKQDLISGRLTAGHARALLGLENEKEIEALRREVVKKGLSVRETEDKVRHRKTSATKAAPPVKDIFIKDVEARLKSRLGTQVDIVPQKKGGKLVIHYYSIDDLDRLLDLIVPKS